MKYAAILGFGIVGGGIPGVLEADHDKINALVGDDIEIKYILDLRSFDDSPYHDKIVHDINVILDDGDISVVAETMGGSHPAYEFSMLCMQRGKSVVTSNKEVVAAYGDKLLECARENGVHYMFEASVGGGIPILRAFATSLSGEKINKITGIVNGTTNYILTRMKNASLSFEDALSEAQTLGFAEKNPSADIDGIDAQRKITILLALATGKLVDGGVYTKGLRGITSEDMRSAELAGGEIKLIACAELGDKTACACVSPMIVTHRHMISNISDVYNGITVEGETLGDVMFCGKGAGRIATAGAVTADICAVLSGAAESEKTPVFEKVCGEEYLTDYRTIRCDWCITASCPPSDICEIAENISDKTEILESNDGKARVVVYSSALAELENALSETADVSIIRVI